MNDNLLPCPFCGATILKRGLTAGEYIVFCDNCGAYGPNDLSRELADKMWNTRRPMAELQAQLSTCQDGNVELLQEKWALQQSLVQLMNVLAELVNAVKRGDARGGPEMENALDAIRKGV